MELHPWCQQPHYFSPSKIERLWGHTLSVLCWFSQRLDIFSISVSEFRPQKEQPGPCLCPLNKQEISKGLKNGNSVTNYYTSLKSYFATMLSRLLVRNLATMDTRSCQAATVCDEGLPCHKV